MLLFKLSMSVKSHQQRDFEALVYRNLEKEQCFPNVKQVKDSAQKQGISSSCVLLITIIVQREQDALQNS